MNPPFENRLFNPGRGLAARGAARLADPPPGRDGRPSERGRHFTRRHFGPARVSPESIRYPGRPPPAALHRQGRPAPALPLGLPRRATQRGGPHPRLLRHHRQAYVRRLHPVRPGDLGRPGRPLPHRRRLAPRPHRSRGVQLRTVHRRLRAPLRHREGRGRRRAGGSAATPLGRSSSSRISARRCWSARPPMPCTSARSWRQAGSAPNRLRCDSATSAGSRGPRS